MSRREPPDRPAGLRIFDRSATALPKIKDGQTIRARFDGRCGGIGLSVAFATFWQCAAEGIKEPAYCASRTGLPGFERPLTTHDSILQWPPSTTVKHRVFRFNKLARRSTSNQHE